MALTADAVTAGEATEVFITLRRYLPYRERLGREGVSREVAAVGTQTSVRQPPRQAAWQLTPPWRAPRRPRSTCGTNASAERSCLAPLGATTPRAHYPARGPKTRGPVSALGTILR